ncbi:acetyl-CoA carboxylase biotin carboxyl carrier protein [Terrarubrum flagellatum]|uniref:acetyl-CoA carboxylase biotin carboxyl carrier protein n=1 Tax=Terrirubrum flagellatum TaxID=2895980 RepID=UPI00314568C7
MSSGASMSPFERVTEISAWLAASDVDELILSGPSGTLRLTRGASGQVEAHIGESDNSEPPPLATITAHGFGVFLDRHPLDAEPLAPVGALVRADTPIGFLRIGPLLTPVVAPVDGVVENILVQNEDVVGFGAPLFELEPVERDSVS